MVFLPNASNVHEMSESTKIDDSLARILLNMNFDSLEAVSAEKTLGVLGKTIFMSSFFFTNI